MAFTDELATGVVPAGSPELLGAFELTPARAAGWTLVAFGALWLDDALAVDAGRRAAVLTAWVAGGIAGAALLERASRRLRPATLLAGSGWAAGRRTPPGS